MAEAEIQQVTVSQEDAYKAVELLSEFSAGESSRRKERVEKEGALLEAAYSPFRALFEGDPEAMSALRELQLHAVFDEENHASTRVQAEDSSGDFSGSLIEIKPFALPGSSVFGLPYAFDWKKTGSSLGAASTDKAAGNFSASEEVGPLAERFGSESALGFAMRSPTQVTVRVSAFMPIHFEIDIQPISYRSAGVEVLAQIGVWRDDGVNVLKSEAVPFRLWQPMAQRRVHTGEVHLGDFPQANPRLLMLANRTYFVWHTGIVGAYGNGNRVRARVDCRLPFVVVAPV